MGESQKFRVGTQMLYPYPYPYSGIFKRTYPYPYSGIFKRTYPYPEYCATGVQNLQKFRVGVLMS